MNSRFLRGAGVVLAGCQLLLLLVFPAVKPVEQREMTTAGGADPSYAVYQKYRYAYENYVYLFLSEETGEGMDLGLGNASLEGGAVGEGTGPEAQAGVAESGLPGTDGPGSRPQEGNGGNLAEVYAKIQDYDYLMKRFYNVHPSTTAPRDLMKAETFLETDLGLEKNPEVPQILVYHTHSQETYADYGPDRPDANVVEVGNVLTDALRAKGWNVIHDTSTYDIQGGKLDRNKAYSYALEGITQILDRFPEIQVVLDIHRDGVGEHVRLVTDINGVPTANIMFFQGMSRTPEGEIAYLPNPNLKSNLAFSFQMQWQAAESFPGLTRKIYLKGLRYNLHLRERSALVEVGAQTNTVEEAKQSMVALAEVLDRVLQGK